MKPKTVEKKVREPIVLSKTAYLRLLRLLRWLEDTPEEVELGDHTIDQIEAAIDRYLPDLGEESVTVELTEGRLVAVFEDDEGETRVPIRGLRE